MKKENGNGHKPHRITTCATRGNPAGKTTEEQLEQLAEGTAGSQLTELMHLTALDEKLARGLHGLVDTAIRAAKAKKPDTRLLRLIIRYSGARNRLLASIQHKR
jgi:hypothetical protein